MVADTMQPVADNVQSVVLAGAGHWVAEQAPEELLAALTTFLAPYRDGDGLDLHFIHMRSPLPAAFRTVR